VGSRPRGTLRIAAPVTFGSMHLGGPIARYLEAHPNVRVEVELDDRYVDLIDQLTTEFGDNPPWDAQILLAPGRASVQSLGS
jgi:DNA-binding transcriptional LysR family regulator